MNSSIVISPAATIKDWLRLARLPFHLVGVAPLLVGYLWVGHGGELVDWSLAAWATVAVVLIMLSTYLTGEYFDQQVDTLSAKYGPSNFAGGSKVLLEGRVRPRTVLIAANLCALATIGVGLYIQVRFETGPWTIPFGAFGLLAGYFYSSPPFRWVKRGLGEMLIGVSYGFLPVYAGAYLQTGRFDTALLCIAAPIALSIFMVILINEFPDYRADRETGKRNLPVLLGLRRAAALYVLFQALFVVSLLWLMLTTDFGSIWLLLPLALGAMLGSAVALGLHGDPKKLELICGSTILLNLCYSGVMILTLW